MKFGEKVRQLRREKGMTQAQLAKQAGLGLRTVISYEKGESYPKKRSVYDALADIFGVDVNYLRTEDEEFLTAAAEQYGAQGQRGAMEALRQAKVAFAGGTLSEEDQVAFMLEIQQLYLQSKEIARKKFASGGKKTPQD